MNHCVPLRRAFKRLDLMFLLTVSSLDSKVSGCLGYGEFLGHSHVSISTLLDTLL